MKSIMQIENVNYIYNTHTALSKKAVNNITFNIFENEILGIIGSTGSGKTTLSLLLNGILKPSNGYIKFYGKDINNNFKENIHSKIGLVFQNPEHQLFAETIEKEIAFGPINLKIDDKEIESRIQEALKFVNLPYNIKNKSPFELSDGQKKRISIAGVIAMQPKILILDEPTIGLDPLSKKEIYKNIINYKNKNNKTIIIVSHNMDDIIKYCDRILVMHDSNMLMLDSVEKIFNINNINILKKANLDIPIINKILLELKKIGYNFQEENYKLNNIIDIIIKQSNII